MKITEKQINSKLAAMPADRRPETATRSRVQSVAVAARGYWEATDRDGHISHVPASTVMAWMKI